MEVPNYNYGPVTNGTETGTGLLGTVAAAVAGSNIYNSTPLKGYLNISSVDVDVSDYSQAIENLKEENESLKARVELLELQFKFMLNKFTEVEKFIESSK